MSNLTNPSLAARAGDPKGSSTSAAAAVVQPDALGEDDEFEDFPVENWTESESDISHFANPTNKSGGPASTTTVVSGGTGSTTAGSKKVTMDDLWEDNWDDDVIESDFAHQLRAELEKTKTNGNGPAPMQT